MIGFLIHLLVSAAILYGVAAVVNGMQIKSPGAAVLAALVLAVTNALVRPVLVFLTLPLTVLTLGLFLFVVNAIMLRLVAAVVPGFAIAGWTPALLASLAIALVKLLIGLVV